jgi:hypothetical protein
MDLDSGRRRAVVEYGEEEVAGGVFNHELHLFGADGSQLLPVVVVHRCTEKRTFDEQQLRVDEFGC